jgi:hypothetical protein
MTSEGHSDAFAIAVALEDIIPDFTEFDGCKLSG